MSLSQTPAYNLKAVLKETGLAADTLRAWERRYGLPKPERTPGGHRLYSLRDIHLIKWLMARQAEGLTISRAVDQWNESVASGTDPLADSAAASLPAAQAFTTIPTNLDELRTKWLAACLAFNEINADQILNQAFALYPVETVITDLIQRGLHDMGAMWFAGEATVQQEHFASALAERRMDALIAAAPAPHRKETLLLACPPDEWHALPLLLLNLLLRRRGWKVVYLGANVPIAQLEETIQAVQPALVVLVAQQLTTAATTQHLSVLLAKRGVPVAYGGRIFNEITDLRTRIEGEFLGERIETAPERLEQLTEEQGTARKRAAKSTADPGQSQVTEAFLLNRRLIESTVAQRLSQADIKPKHITVANLHFGNALAAALELGNITYLESDMEWIRNLLASHDLPGEVLHAYLLIYSQVTREIMGFLAVEITDWLEGYIVRL